MVFLEEKEKSDKIIVFVKKYHKKFNRIRGDFKKRFHNLGMEIGIATKKTLCYNEKIYISYYARVLMKNNRKVYTCGQMLI